MKDSADNEKLLLLPGRITQSCEAESQRTICNRMKNALNKEMAGSYTSISLQVLVNQLVDNLPETIALNKVMVENEVPPNLTMTAAYTLAIPVIDELLTAILSNARDTCIAVTAEKLTDTVILNFEDRNNYNGYALAFSLMSISRQARLMGGNINIEGAQKRVVNISFSFPDTAGTERKVYPAF